MDRERWKLVEEVYHRVASRSAGERRTALEAACAGDPDLHEEVASLLAALDEQPGFLSHGDLVAEIADLAAESDGLPVPSDFGAYHVLERIGAGAMGEVYRARDTRLDREVALKILPPRFTHDRARVARFQLEAKAASALNHPGIVTIFEIGETAGTRFIATELVEGVTLRDQLVGGPLARKDVIEIGIACADALAAAHRAGIIHRDVKPENIMLRRDGVVKVLDFGLARMTEAERAPSPYATESGTTLGTPRYMSPEQARREPLDARSDIFSLGAVLFELQTGEPALPGATAAEVFAALLSTAPVAAVGDDLGAIIAKALDRDRAHRYQTMDDVAAALRALDPQVPSRGSGDRARATPGSPGRSRRATLVAAAAGLVAAVGAAAYLRTGGREAAPAGPAELALVPLTTFKGPKDFAQFSPDGREIAFSWNGDRPGISQRRIYRKPLDGEPVQLTDGADDTWPAWSPDGREIAFVRGGTSVYVVSAAGGEARAMVSGAGPGVSWSPDGRWLAVADELPPQGSGGIVLFGIGSGERRTLTAPQTGRDQSPVFSPDGQSIAFMRLQEDCDIYVVPIGGGTAARVTSDGVAKLGGMAWTADGGEILYSTQREYGGSGLWRVPRAGGQPRRIAETLAFAGNPTLSRDGRRLAYTESWIDTNIYLSDLPAAGASTASAASLDGPQRLIASTREDHSASFSPDGSRIAFISNRSGDSEVWVAARDGTQQSQVTHLQSFAGTPRWSPDGRWIAFDLQRAGNPDVWIVGTDGSSPHALTTTRAGDTKPSWSPDGQWIYFTSSRSGVDQIWKMRPDGTMATQVTRMGAREALATADGRTVYFTKTRPGPIWMVAADGTGERPVPGLEAFGSVGRAWAVTPQGIYFLPVEPLGRASIRYFDFATRHVSPVQDWADTAPWTGPALAIAPDGRFLLTVRTDQQINDLMMIENFR